MDWTAIGIGVGVLAALVGVVWKMLNDKIDRNDEKLWDQIGHDSDSGMRKVAHLVPNLMAQNQALHSRLERLETWRNGKS